MRLPRIHLTVRRLLALVALAALVATFVRWESERHDHLLRARLTRRRLEVALEIAGKSRVEGKISPVLPRTIAYLEKLRSHHEQAARYPWLPIPPLPPPPIP